MSWMSKKHERSCTTLNYIENILILGSTISGCISVSAFAFLVGIPIVITSSAFGLNICAITTTIKKNKTIIKKGKRNMIK